MQGQHFAQRQVIIPVQEHKLIGDLTVPSTAAGLVIFVHGSGSSRHSPRNQAVAKYLNQNHQATLLFDLLTHDEDQNRMFVFDIALLSSRLLAATHWIRRHAELSGLPFGFFGASTGAAAALVAAAELGGEVAAVVSRGGRPDLAGAESLARVEAPTMLLVGGADTHVLELNRWAKQRMHCFCQLAIVPGASHLFEEPGALDVVVRTAGDWFTDHFRRAPHGEPVFWG